MLNQALAGRKEYHDRTCADMVRGRFPAPWHNLNINDMGDNILRKAADELKKAGCRVFAWQDDTYNRGWSKGDYTMLYYAFPDSPNIGYLSHGEYGMSVAYSRAYIPSCGSGSGCCVKEEATFDLETALDVLNGPLPRWCRSYGVYPSSTIILINGIIAIIITKNYLRRFDMEVKDWENLVLNTEVGSHCFVTLIDNNDISRGYAQIRRAEHFGYNICFTRLYGNKFYFEKIEEGRTQQYINRRK